MGSHFGVWFLAPTWRLTIVYNASSRGSSAVFWPEWAPGTQVAHIHAYRLIIITENKKLYIKNAIVIFIGSITNIAYILLSKQDVKWQLSPHPEW